MIFIIAAIIVSLAVIFIFSNLLGKRENLAIERIKIYTSTGEHTVEEKEGKRENLFDKIDEKIEKKNLSQKIQTNLQKADLPLRISEYLLLNLLSTTVGMLFGYILGQTVGMIILGILGLKVLPFYVKMQQKKRQKLFQEQLEGSLTLTSNCLKSGYSFLQAVEMVARESPQPTSVEFYKILRETALGLPLEDALTKLAQRIESDDFDLLITSVIIQRQTGGNLAEILDNIGTTIRERVRLKGEISALTAMGKMSGGVVSTLPIGLAILLYFMNPDYMIPFFASTLGRMMIGVGIIMMGLGMFVIKKIITIEV